MANKEGNFCIAAVKIQMLILTVKEFQGISNLTHKPTVNRQSYQGAIPPLRLCDWVLINTLNIQQNLSSKCLSSEKCLKLK